MRQELSSQQQAVVREACPPGVVRPPVVVVSAAGSGKTTALVAAAGALAAEGHSKICYAVFNKAAQADAVARLGGLPVVAKTLHAHAHTLCAASNVGGDEVEARAVAASGIAGAKRRERVLRSLRQFLTSASNAEQWERQGGDAVLAMAVFSMLAAKGGEQTSFDTVMEQAQLLACGGGKRMDYTACSCRQCMHPKGENGTTCRC